MSNLRAQRRFGTSLGIVLWLSFWTGFGETLQGSESSLGGDEPVPIAARCEALRREQRSAMAAHAAMPNQERESGSPLLIIVCWILDE